MANGRPTILNEDLLKKAEEYLSSCIGKLPTKEGLALYLHVSRDTIYAWGRGTEGLEAKFSYIFDKIMAEQGERLIQGGLYGKFNPTITKMMLSKHGYIEQTATDLTTKGKEMPAPILGGLGKNVRPDDSDSQDSQSE